jgi:hypothetical protein
MRIIKLHIGLFTYLRTELKKSRKPNELVRFLQSVGKSYFQELIKLYKELFKLLDPDFQKQKKQYEQYNKLRTDLQRALKLLQYIDKNMGKMGRSRQERRAFWREFFKDGQIRTEVFNDLQKEIGGK